MEPILSKQEIADLLSTLQQRTPAERSALHGAADSDAPAYTGIDLFHLPRGSHQPEKIPNFDIILELFADYFGTALSRFFPCTIEVTANGIEYQRYSTYLVLESPPGAIALFKAEPLKYGGLITFSQQLAFPLLELMLGGAPHPGSVQPDRTATEIELSVLQSLMERGCIALQQSLFPVVRVDTQLVKMSHDRRLLSLAGGDTEVAVCTLQVKADQHCGSMQLVFPAQSFAPYRETLHNLLHLDDLEADGWREPLAAAVDSLPCTVMARTATIDMTIRDLIALETGDVLRLPCKPGTRIALLVEGKHKFSGYQKIRDRKRYIHITGSIE